MSLGDWGASEGQQRFASAGPVTVTAPGSTNAKGAWTQVVAATAFDAAALLLSLTAATTNGTLLADVAIGASGSEQIIVANLQLRRISSAQHSTGPLLLPIPIPAGTRISVRYQLSATGIVVTAAATIIAATWNAQSLGGRSATYGAVTASSSGTVVDPGGAANAKGAWTEIASATDVDSNWLLLSVLPSGTAVAAGTTYLIDVGVGASGGEQVVIPDLPVYVSTTVESALFRILLPVSIPAGARVAVRAQCTSATTPGREREVVAHLFS